MLLLLEESNGHAALLLKRCMQECGLHINGMQVQELVIRDFHENAHNIEGDSRSKGAMIVNTELLTEALSYQTSLVLLEHPIGIILPHQNPLALDQISFRRQLSILSHLQLVE